MAKLSHPNIMPVFFVGREKEVPFFVMPRLSGGSIGEVIRREGRIDLAQVMRVATDIASALDYAHAAGLVHRDETGEYSLTRHPRAVLTDSDRRRRADGPRRRRCRAYFWERTVRCARTDHRWKGRWTLAPTFIALRS
jgi:serine/threonine protein kinase